MRHFRSLVHTTPLRSRSSTSSSCRTSNSSNNSYKSNDNSHSNSRMGLVLGISKLEEPAHKVLEKDKSFEIREYAPVIIAEVTVHGDMQNAGNQGFRMVADYIFGNNIKQDKSEKIAMTVPVSMTPNNPETSQKIAMTAPVTLGNSTTTDEWKLNFFMPREYTMETLPKPINDAVKIKEAPGKTCAVVGFSGICWDSTIKEKSEELQQWMARHNLRPQGPFQLARYNPPWTLPFLRRNEILFEIEGGSAAVAGKAQ